MLRYMGGAYKCYACGQVRAVNLPNPTTYTVATPVCHCEEGIMNIMTPIDDGAFALEEMNGDPWDFCKNRGGQTVTGEHG